jgi:hypothetical protein
MIGSLFGNWVLIDGPENSKSDMGAKCANAAIDLSRRFQVTFA